MKEFKTMEDAVALAMHRCEAFVVPESKEEISVEDALLYANELDEELNRLALKRQYTFYCSIEGAVGISEGKEYMAQWILLPVPDIFKDTEERIRGDYEKFKQEEDAKKRGKAFCTNCGEKLEPGLKFCTKCGHKL